MTKLPPGRYIHYKGLEYEVIGLGIDQETMNEVVVYRGLYDSEEFGNYPLWTRSIEAFTETVEVDGKDVPRFVYVG